MNDVFGRIADLGIRWPWRVVVSCLLFLVVGAGISATLTVDSSRLTMVSSDNPHQALQMQYFERFGLPNALIVVIRGGEILQRHAVATDITTRLSTEPSLQNRVLTQVGPTSMAELLFLQTSFDRPAGFDADGFMQSADGQQHYVLILPDIPGTQQVHEVAPTVRRVRDARDAALAAVGAPDVTADVTGPAALVVDEQREIQRGIAVTSGATALAILVLLFLAFRSVRYTLLAMLPVVVGVVGTMAVARLLYGGLNMVTSSASSILLGLGIDFGVFLIGRYGEFLRAGLERDDAIRETLRKAGLGLVVGSVTTALAFLTTTVTEFTAYARLGVVVAVGLLLMMATTLVLVPALLALTGRRSVPAPPQLRGVTALPGLVRKAPRALVAVALVLALGSVAGFGTLRFNTRFYDFIPAHIEGARALLAIEQDPTVTPLRATVPVEGIEPARALAEQLRALPSVAAVQSPSDALPPLDLEALRARVATPPPEGSPEPLLRAWQTARNVADRGGYLPTDLPPLLREQFVSRDGLAVGLQVIPRGNIWDPVVAEQFAREVSGVAPLATGMAMHIHAHLTFIREGFTWAAGAAALLVMLTVGAAFLSVRDAALAMLPCVLGFVWMLGGMAVFAIPFDAANIVVLPLILGIGVDAGVHLMERVRQSEREHGMARLDDVLMGTGASVALASTTTLAGFAALMLADYGAMQSLGRVMSLGMVSCMAASLIALPALLVMMKRAR